MQHPINYLELHVAHTCNLSCVACGHYSQHHLGGVVSIDAAEEWSKKWQDRIQPKTLGLLGGEPSLHPDLPQFVRAMKGIWQKSQIVIKTNGFFLYRHPELRKALQETNSELEINCHSDTPDYMSQYTRILETVEDWHDIKVTLKNSTDDEKARPWTRKYFGFGSTLTPFQDNNPRRSWELCHAKYCLTLFEGRLWKCPPLAYLKIIANKYDLKPEWNPYLAYSGLESDCSNTTLLNFLSKEDEPACAMCPAHEIRVTKGNPMEKGMSV